MCICAVLLSPVWSGSTTRTIVSVQLTLLINCIRLPTSPFPSRYSQDNDGETFVCMEKQRPFSVPFIHSFIHIIHIIHIIHFTSRHVTFPPVPSRPVPSRPVPSRPVPSRHVTSRHAIMPSCHHVIISSCHHVISFRSIRFHSIPSVLFPSESCIRYCIRNTVHMSAIRT